MKRVEIAPGGIESPSPPPLSSPRGLTIHPTEQILDMGDRPAVADKERSFGQYAHGVADKHSIRPRQHARPPPKCQPALPHPPD